MVHNYKLKPQTGDSTNMFWVFSKISYQQISGSTLKTLAQQRTASKRGPEKHSEVTVISNGGYNWFENATKSSYNTVLQLKKHVI